MRRLLSLALLLAAGSASAQEEGLAPLNGVGRISVQGGWRLSSNDTFYDSFYALPGSQGAQRAPESRGGPFATGSFAYAVTDLIELGVDLFATSEQLRLTGAPTLTNVTYGALLGVRFQGLLDVLTPEGVVPFVGIETGPTLALSQAEGVGVKEVFTQAFVGSVGATFRLSPRWGITAEYRLAFARGQSAFSRRKEYEQLASYNAGGNWFAVGVTYMLPADPSRPIGSGLP